MKKKSHLIMVLALALILSGGAFAYTYTTASGTIAIAEPTGDIVSCDAAETQPDWGSILNDLASENKTCGEVPSGDLFTISPDATFGGDLIAKVYLANTGNLTKAYSYLNMKLYLEGSVEAGETPDYRLLTLQNGEAALTLEEILPTSGSWTETTQPDFADSTLNQVDVNTSPGDVILDKYSDNVTDTYDDETMIASSANVTVSGGQVKLNTSGQTPATETLRPDGDGDETGIEEPDPLLYTHWDLVDDVTPDGNSTYVATESNNWQEDLYTIADHSTGAGAINYVRVYFVAREQTEQTPTTAYVHIKTNGVEYNGTEVATTTSYTAYSYQWNTNPQTGNPWTWDEIDALQIGVGLRRPKPNQWTRVTQVYAEVNHTPYNPTGTLTSINLLSGEAVVSIDSFDYIASAIPSGTSLQVQFSQDGTNWYNSAGTPDGWDTLSEGTNNIDLSGLGWSGPNFYYHMLFTSDGSDTPVLDEIRVNFSTYYLSGDLISSSHDNGYDLEWDWGTISFTVTEPSATDVKFQIRTAATEAGLSSATWYGPTGTTDYYQTSGTAINSVHDGDRWVQYRAYLSGPGGVTPIFSDITITYSAQAAIYTIEIIGGGYCLVSDNTSDWDEGWTTTPEFYCDVTPR